MQEREGNKKHFNYKRVITSDNEGREEDAKYKDYLKQMYYQSQVLTKEECSKEKYK